VALLAAVVAGWVAAGGALAGLVGGVAACSKGSVWVYVIGLESSLVFLRVQKLHVKDNALRQCAMKKSVVKKDLQL